MALPARPPAADPSVTALLEAARRCVRGGAPRSVLLLHLADADGVQPHHLRVARAILTDVAQRLDGEVLRLADGDLALICRFRPDAVDAIGPDGTGPEGLPAVLDRLFAAAIRAGGRLHSSWRLPAEAEAMRHTLLSRAPAPRATPAPLAEAPGDALARLIALATAEAGAVTLRRQVGVRLHLDDGPRRFRPCFQEVTAATATPGADPAGALAGMDPFLLRHLARDRDQITLVTLAAQLDVEPFARLPGAVHVNLAPSAILSDECAVLARLCRERGGRLGVELAIAEAGAAPAQFEAARARLQELQAELILDGFTGDAFAGLRPASLGASLLKLEWRPDLARLAGLARGRLVEALHDAGAAKVVLIRAETEAALTWGLSHGITLFQGRHVDAMLAAGRLSACRFAAGCTLRECIDRAAATDPPPRAGCLDHAVLDGSAISDFMLPA